MTGDTAPRGSYTELMVDRIPRHVTGLSPSSMENPNVAERALSYAEDLNL